MDMGTWGPRYMRLYTAAGKDRAMSYAGFFLFYMVHIGFCIWSAVAPPFFGNSFAGLLSLIDIFKESKGIGVRVSLEYGEGISLG